MTFRSSCNRRRWFCINQVVATTVLFARVADRGENIAAEGAALQARECVHERIKDAAIVRTRVATTPKKMPLMALCVVLRAGLHTYPEWWRRNLNVVNVERSHRRAVIDAVDNGVLPEELRGRGQDLWDGFLQSVGAHRALPQTLIHGDVHLGNWYTTAGGNLGLSDWQCVSVGHWSRDLAYALASTLTIEQRRAWEGELIDNYLDLLNRGGGAAVDFHSAYQMYRRQLLGALTMWTPTYRPPPMMPKMQPIPVAEEMLRRIGAAIVDHDALSA